MLTKHLAMFARARLTIVWALRAKPQHKPSRALLALACSQKG